MVPLFLDIDGVCNTIFSEDYFTKFNMGNLKHLVNTINPKVVLSSDWRRSPQNLAIARSELLFYGITIFDTTPIKSFGFRKEEIREWLAGENWDKAIILDDMSAELVDPQMGKVFFLRTDNKLGLTEEDVDKVIGWFNGT